MTYYSEHGQDRWLEENVFRGKRGGVFVEFGALDGITDSNSLFFERERGWTGLLIEPNPPQFSRLLANDRRATKLHAAVGETHGMAPFIRVAGVYAGWSGIDWYMDPRHRERIRDQGGQTQSFWVPTLPLTAILQEFALPRIDYLSVDVEGAEYAVLAKLDFARFWIDVVEVENNYGDPAVESLMVSRGYSLIQRLGVADIYRLE